MIEKLYRAARFSSQIHKLSSTFPAPEDSNSSSCAPKCLQSKSLVVPQSSGPCSSIRNVSRTSSARHFPRPAAAKLSSGTRNVSKPTKSFKGSVKNARGFRIRSGKLFGRKETKKIDRASFTTCSVRTYTKKNRGNKYTEEIKLKRILSEILRTSGMKYDFDEGRYIGYGLFRTDPNVDYIIRHNIRDDNKVTDNYQNAIISNPSKTLLSVGESLNLQQRYYSTKRIRIPLSPPQENPKNPSDTVRKSKSRVFPPRIKTPSPAKDPEEPLVASKVCPEPPCINEPQGLPYFYRRIETKNDNGVKDEIQRVYFKYPDKIVKIENVSKKPKSSSNNAAPVPKQVRENTTSINKYRLKHRKFPFYNDELQVEHIKKVVTKLVKKISEEEYLTAISSPLQIQQEEEYYRKLLSNTENLKQSDLKNIRTDVGNENNVTIEYKKKISPTSVHKELHEKTNELAARKNEKKYKEAISSKEEQKHKETIVIKPHSKNIENKENVTVLATTKNEEMKTEMHAKNSSIEKKAEFYYNMIDCDLKYCEKVSKELEKKFNLEHTLVNDELEEKIKAADKEIYFYLKNSKSAIGKLDTDIVPQQLETEQHPCETSLFNMGSKQFFKLPSPSKKIKSPINKLDIDIVRQQLETKQDLVTKHPRETPMFDMSSKQFFKLPSPSKMIQYNDTPVNDSISTMEKLKSQNATKNSFSGIKNLQIECKFPFDDVCDEINYAPPRSGCQNPCRPPPCPSSKCKKNKKNDPCKKKPKCCSSTEITKSVTCNMQNLGFPEAKKDTTYDNYKPEYYEFKPKNKTEMTNSLHFEECYPWKSCYKNQKSPNTQNVDIAKNEPNKSTEYENIDKNYNAIEDNLKLFQGSASQKQFEDAFSKTFIEAKLVTSIDKTNAAFDNLEKVSKDVMKNIPNSYLDPKKKESFVTKDVSLKKKSVKTDTDTLPFENLETYKLPLKLNSIKDVKEIKDLSHVKDSRTVKSSKILSKTGETLPFTNLETYKLPLKSVKDVKETKVLSHVKDCPKAVKSNTILSVSTTGENLPRKNLETYKRALKSVTIKDAIKTADLSHVKDISRALKSNTILNISNIGETLPFTNLETYKLPMDLPPVTENINTENVMCKKNDSNNSPTSLSSKNNANITELTKVIHFPQIKSFSKKDANIKTEKKALGVLNVTIKIPPVENQTLEPFILKPKANMDKILRFEEYKKQLMELKSKKPVEFEPKKSMGTMTVLLNPLKKPQTKKKVSNELNKIEKMCKEELLALQSRKILNQDSTPDNVIKLSHEDRKKVSFSKYVEESQSNQNINKVLLEDNSKHNFGRLSAKKPEDLSAKKSDNPKKILTVLDKIWSQVELQAMKIVKEMEKSNTSAKQTNYRIFADAQIKQLNSITDLQSKAVKHLEENFKHSTKDLLETKKAEIKSMSEEKFCDFLSDPEIKTNVINQSRKKSLQKSTASACPSHEFISRQLRNTTNLEALKVQKSASFSSCGGNNDNCPKYERTAKDPFGRCKPDPYKKKQKKLCQTLKPLDLRCNMKAPECDECSTPSINSKNVCKTTTCVKDVCAMINCEAPPRPFIRNPCSSRCSKKPSSCPKPNPCKKKSKKSCRKPSPCKLDPCKNMSTSSCSYQQTSQISKSSFNNLCNVTCAPKITAVKKGIKHCSGNHFECKRPTSPCKPPEKNNECDPCEKLRKKGKKLPTIITAPCSPSKKKKKKRSPCNSCKKMPCAPCKKKPSSPCKNKKNSGPCNCGPSKKPSELKCSKMDAMCKGPNTKSKILEAPESPCNLPKNKAKELEEKKSKSSCFQKLSPCQLTKPASPCKTSGIGSPCKMSGTVNPCKKSETLNLCKNSRSASTCGKSKGTRPCRRTRATISCRKSKDKSPCKTSRPASTCKTSRPASTCKTSRPPSSCRKSKAASPCKKSRSASPCKRTRSASSCGKPKAKSLCKRTKPASRCQKSRSASPCGKSKSKSPRKTSRPPSTCKTSRPASPCRKSGSKTSICKSSASKSCKKPKRPTFAAYKNGPKNKNSVCCLRETKPWLVNKVPCTAGNLAIFAQKSKTCKLPSPKCTSSSNASGVCYCGKRTKEKSTQSTFPGDAPSCSTIVINRHIDLEEQCDPKTGKKIEKKAVKKKSGHVLPPPTNCSQTPEMKEPSRIKKKIKCKIESTNKSCPKNSKSFSTISSPKCDWDYETKSDPKCKTETCSNCNPVEMSSKYYSNSCRPFPVPEILSPCPSQPKMTASDPQKFYTRDDNHRCEIHFKPAKIHKLHNFQFKIHGSRLVKDNFSEVCHRIPPHKIDKFTKKKELNCNDSKKCQNSTEREVSKKYIKKVEDMIKTKQCLAQPAMKTIPHIPPKIKPDKSTYFDILKRLQSKLSDCFLLYKKAGDSATNSDSGNPGGKSSL